MDNNLLSKIIEQSKTIDWSGADIEGGVKIDFPVPIGHPRHSRLDRYSVIVDRLGNYNFQGDDLIICDQEVKKFLTEAVLSLPGVVFFDASEGYTKTLEVINRFCDDAKKSSCKRVVAIGGGIIGNAASYVAEKLETDLIMVPTTVLSMSDASTGGKVRVNDIVAGKFIKHAYKSFYEPSLVIIDPLFLTFLNNEQIKSGLAEVIKHGLYQSHLLVDYILSNSFQPFSDKSSLLKAILWTVDLKRVCLELDPGESPDGSYSILRAAHDISDKLEEQSGFTLPHGNAVEKAMVQDLYANKDAYNNLIKIYDKLGIGYSTILP